MLGIIAQTYTGNAGNIILVTAEDNFKVAAVKVAITNVLNELIEEGDAIANPDGISWNYTVTQHNANVAGCVIKATAFDVPGNEGVLEVVV